MNHRTIMRYVWHLLCRNRLLLAVALCWTALADPAVALGGQFEQSWTRTLTQTSSDLIAFTKTQSRLTLTLLDLTLSGFLERQDEVHSSKLNLSNHQELVRLEFSPGFLDLNGTVEHLQLSFPKAAAKDKTTLSFQMAASLPLESLTVTSDLNFESRTFPKKMSKNEILSDLALTGRWATDRWKLILTFQGDERFFPNDTKSHQRACGLKADLDLSFDGWSCAATLSQGLLTFSNDPQRNEFDFDNSLELAAELAILSVTLSATLSDVVRPFDLSGEKHLRQLSIKLAGEVLGWQLDFKLTDERTAFPRDAKKDKTFQEHAFNAEKNFETWTLSALFRQEETNLLNDPAKDKHLTESQLKTTWSLVNAEFQMTLDAQLMRFSSNPAKDLDEGSFSCKLAVSLLDNLKLSLLSQLGRSVSPHDPSREETAATLELSLAAGF